MNHIPFAIASWDQDKENKTRNITALIQRWKGFTRLLQAQPTAVRAFLEGPYGESPLAEDYSNVILFALGIGIAAHLGCIKQLPNARDQGPLRTQVISLLWEVNELSRGTRLLRWCISRSIKMQTDATGRSLIGKTQGVDLCATFD